MIDSADTKDRDDALWVVRHGSGWRAWVHVADVASQVPVGSTIEAEALRRAVTVYRADRTEPMLPAALEAQAALSPGRPTATFLIQLDVAADGELTEAAVSPGQLPRPIALSHQLAGMALSEPAHPQHAMLVEALHLARSLLSRRQAAGALALYDLLHGWATNEEGQIVRVPQAHRNDGYIIVQELMIAANQAVAAWCVQRELPVLFRNHKPAAVAPDRDQLLSDLALATQQGDAARLDTLGQTLRMVLRAAEYQPIVSGHFGLNLAAYTHITSPLRRAADLINQRVIIAAVAGQQPPYTAELLHRLGAQLNETIAARKAAKADAFKQQARAERRQALGRESLAGLDDDGFGRVLRLAVAEDRHSPLLAAEIASRLRRGALQPRDATVLYFAAGAQWTPQRELVHQWLLAGPANAITVLSQFGQRDSGAVVRWAERPVGTVTEPLFSVQAQLPSADGTVSSPERVARSKKAARQQAALALVAQLAGMPDPTRDQADSVASIPRAETFDPIPADHHPASAVNELAQRGQLIGLSFSFTRTGPAHEPTFTCTAYAEQPGTGRKLTGTGSASGKAAAKTLAAADLWRQIQSGNSGQGVHGGTLLA